MNYQGLGSMSGGAKPVNEAYGWKYEALSSPDMLYGRGDTPQQALNNLRSAFKNTGTSLGDNDFLIWRRWNSPEEMHTEVQVVPKQKLKGFVKVDA